MHKKIKIASHSILIVMLALFMMGCSENEQDLVSDTVNNAAVKDSVTLTAEAEQEFSRGQYGNAERLYRQAVESNPRNLNAWIGIGATYDNLKKFDQANRAYMIAVEIKGYTPEILNNLGFHYILRGDYDRAEKVLLAAEKKDPHNMQIKQNLDHLRKSREQSAGKKL